MSSTREKERAADDIAYLKAQDAWVRWPWVPLKKHTAPGRVDVACAFATGEDKLELFHANIWGFDKTTDFKAIKRERLTAQEIVDAGWEVD